MLKTGFRGERKRILTPFTYSPIRRLLPRRGGNVVTGKRINKLENLEISKFVGGVFWECGDGKNDETSPFTHTPLSQTSLQRGNVATGKRINKLENLEISKFVEGV